MTGPRRNAPTMAERCAEAVRGLTSGARDGATSAEVRQWLEDGGYRATQAEVTTALRKASRADPPLVAGEAPEDGGKTLWRLPGGSS